MFKIKLALFLLIFFNSLYGKDISIFLYTTETNINNYKLLKIEFDNYLAKYKKYAFQAFNKSDTFEKYLKEKNIIVITSSWNFKEISKKYKLKAQFVSVKNKSFTDSKVIIGRKDSQLNGILTTPFSKKYSKKVVSSLLNKNLEIINVPKEIDALMSVGFGMSNLALVSKSSFNLFKSSNKYLFDKLKIFKTSKKTLRIIIASNLDKKINNKLSKIFTKMNNSTNGKKILNMLNSDSFIAVDSKKLIEYGGAE